MTNVNHEFDPQAIRTPDGRYYISDRRLWRCSDPGLTDEQRMQFRADLIAAKAALQKRGGDHVATRQRIYALKTALGELGPVWWADGAPDLSRSMVASSPYADWYLGLGGPR